MRWLVLLFVLGATACGGDVFVSGDASPDAAADSPQADSPGDEPVTFECGKAECGAGQVCVHPCCGGVLACDPLDDAGTCTNGEQPSQTCPPETPCSYVCVPAPPYCAPVDQCPNQQGHDCYEACA